jgi:hypothetical protein
MQIILLGPTAHAKKRNAQKTANTVLTLALLLAACATHAGCQLTGNDPGALERAGIVIDQIDIESKSIFEEADPEQNNAVYRLANRLHIQTREQTLRAQLLFTEQQIFSQRLIDESLRNLRTLRFLREPTAAVTCVADRLVITITSSDVWTLTPTLTFSRKGGANKSSVGIEDNNFLGRGKLFEAVIRNDRNRSTRQLRYEDPNVLGSRHRLQVVQRSSDDGDGGRVAVELPFYALDAKRQWLLNFDSDELIARRSIFGAEADQYRANYRNLEISAGASEGVGANGWVIRQYLGVRQERARFRALPASRFALPADRQLSYPFWRLEALQDRFSTTSSQDQIGRTEDLLLGQSYDVELGAAAKALDSDRNQLVARANYSYGLTLADDVLFLDSHLQGRFGSRTEQQLFGAGLRYYTALENQRRFFVSAGLDVGRKLDLDQPLTLGGENGLRGYPFDYQFGDRRALLTVEQRFYSDWRPLQLFQVGAAAFVDVGKVWGRSAVPAPALGTLANVGFGLRLGNLRSARGNQLHIDFAYPLNARKQERGFQIVIETKPSF